jgi:hypothetical protein
MERRKFTREFNLEAVKLIKERGVTVAQEWTSWVLSRREVSNTVRRTTTPAGIG